MSRHGDAGMRCLAGHQEGNWRHPTILPPCIKCICGEWVRPENWEAHTAPSRSTSPEVQDG